MFDIRGLIQLTLDEALNNEVYSYWQKKTGEDANEYIVYTLSGDSTESFADDDPLTKDSTVTVRYYYRSEKLDTYTGRQAIKNREDTIETSLVNSGFTIPNGKFDAGDVDDIGFCVSVFECEYWRVA